MQAILEKAAASVELKPVKFASGSDGFRGQGKVIEDGVKYQVQVMAIRVGSKPVEAKAKTSAKAKK